MDIYAKKPQNVAAIAAGVAQEDPTALFHPQPLPHHEILLRFNQKHLWNVEYHSCIETLYHIDLNG